MSKEVKPASGCTCPSDCSRFFPVRCPRCEWRGMSNETLGGNSIADTGDYDDLVCPKCVNDGTEPFGGAWIAVVDDDSANASVSSPGGEPGYAPGDCSAASDRMLDAVKCGIDLVVDMYDDQLNAPARQMVNTVLNHLPQNAKISGGTPSAESDC